MSSFYEKLSSKLRSDETVAKTEEQPSAKSVTYSATGDRTSPKKEDSPAVQPVAEKAPDGTDSIDTDLFQSDLRMVVFMSVSGVSAEDIAVTISEESNTLIVEAAQKRPNLPVVKGGKEGEPPEKGIYTKQEVKWKSLYRKIYLPAPFDGGEAEATFNNGVLVVTLPAKHPGVGKKLAVREIQHDEKKK
jgi:HSP20 family molecular chaperone IbpA